MVEQAFAGTVYELPAYMESSKILPLVSADNGKILAAFQSYMEKRLDSSDDLKAISALDARAKMLEQGFDPRLNAGRSYEKKIWLAAGFATTGRGYVCIHYGTPFEPHGMEVRGKGFYDNYATIAYSMKPEVVARQKAYHQEIIGDIKAKAPAIKEELERLYATGTSPEFEVVKSKLLAAKKKAEEDKKKAEEAKKRKK